MTSYRLLLATASAVFLVGATACDSDPSAGPPTDVVADGDADAASAADADANADDVTPDAPDDAGLDSAPDVTPPTWQEDLAFLREEEKLARDVYLMLFDKWSTNIFNNIAQSEQTHTDAVKNLLVAKGLPDPVTDDTVGAFVNPVLAQLFADLVAQGQPTLVGALTVGATIEDLDIRDIAVMSTRTDDPAILAVHASLMCGSRNHLRSFAARLGSEGATYQPQYITEAEYDAIVNAPNENCGNP